MWLITICLLAGYPCQDQIRYGLFDTEEQCIQAMQQPKIVNRVKKYDGKVAAKCQKILSHKLT